MKEKFGSSVVRSTILKGGICLHKILIDFQVQSGHESLRRSGYVFTVKRPVKLNRRKYSYLFHKTDWNIVRSTDEAAVICRTCCYSEISFVN